MAAFTQAIGAPAGARTLTFAARLARLERVSRLLDTAFGIPGTRFRFGWDAIADAVPVVGQLVPHAVSAYIVYEAWKMGAPRHIIAKMVGNIAVDTAIGVVPVAGMIGDAFFKANIRNVKLLREHFNLPR